jgi:hypothetical protein
VLKLKYKEFVDALKGVVSLYKDKQYKDDLKNLFIIADGGSVRGCASSAIIFLDVDMSDVLLNKEEIQEDMDFGVRLSSLLEVLGSYSTLSKTEVEEVHIIKEEHGLKLVVFEVPKDPIRDAKLNQESVFRFPLVKVPSLIKRELEEAKTLIEDFVPQTVNTNNILGQLKLFHPLLTSAGKGAYIFREDDVYAVFASLLVHSTNLSPFKNMKMDKVHIDFLLEVLPLDSEVNVYRDSKESGLELTGFKFDNIKIMMKSNNLNGVLPLKEMPIEGSAVELDKYYLLDVLKRVKTDLTLTFDFPNDIATVTTKTFSQELPFVRSNSKGLDKVGFSIPVNILKDMILPNAELLETVFFYINLENGIVSLKVRDNSGGWFTHIKGLRDK